MPSTTLIGLDGGQLHDFTALCIIERQMAPTCHPHEMAADDRRSLRELLEEPQPATYIVRHLQRFALHTSYVEIVNRVASVFRQDKPRQDIVCISADLSRSCLIA